MERLLSNHPDAEGKAEAEPTVIVIKCYKPSKLALCGFLGLLTLFLVAQEVVVPMIKPGAQISSEISDKIPTNAIAPSTDNALLRSKPSQNASSADSLPIYLLQSSTDEAAVTTWEKLAKQWNMETQYAELFDSASPIPSLPSSSSLDPKVSNFNRVDTMATNFNRTIVMIHTAPKMGSDTLRQACRENMEETCNVHLPPHPKHPINPDPLGYRDMRWLYPLMKQCTDTAHFCVNDMVIANDNMPVFKNVLFVHMFPFRNYNEWAVSAMKQLYDVMLRLAPNKPEKHQKRCKQETEKLERCEPSIREPDLRKYGKAQISKFQDGMVQRIRENNDDEGHIVLLYNHFELPDVMKKLSDLYDIPLLPGVHGCRHCERPVGQCDDAERMLEMFHECFDSQLLELP